MLTIELPAEIEKRLSELAAQSGRSENECAREAILQYIEDLEDTQLALERLKEPGKIWTLEDLERGRDEACS